MPVYDRNELRKHLAARRFHNIEHLLAADGANREEVAEAVVEDVIHSGMLILQRDSPPDRAARDNLRKVIDEFVQHHGSPETKQTLSNHLSDVAVFDRCFAEIRRVLSSLPISQRAPAEQAWAAIERFVDEVRILHEQMETAFDEQRKLGTVLLYDAQSARLRGPSGRPINPDAAVSGMARQLALTLMKLAFENNWFEGKQIVLPARVDVGEDVRYESGTNSLLAFCWNELEDASEEMRYWGGAITEETQQLQTDDDEIIKADVVEFKSDLTHYVWEVIARRRFNQSVLKGSFELGVAPALMKRVRDPRHGPVKPLPEEFVSLDESVVHMILELTYYLKVKNSTENYKGLTLAEWIRGYSILGLYAQSTPGVPVKGIIELDCLDVLRVLERGGLTAGKASHFIDSVTYQRGKRDLYDAPLIRDANRRLYFVAPLFAGVSMAEVVTSQLGSLGVSFDVKGKPFEAAIRSAFNALGLNAQGFEYEAEGRKFQCDVAVFWEDYLFLFECKNDFLPAPRPMLSYRFWSDIMSAAAQVKRIAGHFEADRTIVRKHLGSGDWKQMYPIVLNAMPFSLPGEIDGVYFYDASALQRLLKEESVGIIESIPTGSGRVLLKKPVVRLWEGKRPGPHDLVRQLERPVQVAEYQQRMDVVWNRIAVSENLVISLPSLRSQPTDLDTILDSHGFTEAEVQAFKAEIRSKIQRPSDPNLTDADIDEE